MMTELDRFEARFVAAYRRYLAEAPVKVDAVAIDAAVAHARAHARRERGPGSLWSALNVRFAPVTPGAHGTGSLAFATIALVIVAGLAGAVGGAFLENRAQGPMAVGSSPAAVAAPSATAPSPSPTATPLPAVTAPSPTPTPTPITMAPLHVTGTQSPTNGLACETYCWIGAIVKASDFRLSGCYIMKPVGSDKDATWGTITFYQGEGCNWTPLSWGTDVWKGQWLTAGSRPVLAKGFDQSAVYPVDTISLYGTHADAGLSAVLRMTDAAHLDGWIYAIPTP